MGRKCALCNEMFGIKEKQIPYKNRFVHEKCFNVEAKIIKKEKDKALRSKAEEKDKKAPVKKPVAELKDGMTEEEYQQKKEYYNYLKLLIGEEVLSAKIYKVSEDYIKRYNFTFHGMYLTLKYWFGLLGNEVKGDCVGLIPYHYTEAEKRMSELNKSKEINESLVNEDLYTFKKVQINPHKKVNRKQIDIGRIGGNK